MFLPETVKRLRCLSLTHRRTGGSLLLAGPRKELPGGGTEVTGLRDYAPGDDYRHIHWNWCARRDELLTKVFGGRSDLYIYMLLDCSSSMIQGRPAKLDAARRVVAALGYAALDSLDCLGVAAFADGLTDGLPLLRHLARLPRLLRFLDQLAGRTAPTDLADAARGFVRRYRRPGPVIVVSDFYDRQGFHRGLNLLRHHGYDVRVVHVYDPREFDALRLGDVELADVESGAVNTATVTQRTAARYRELIDEHRRSIGQYCRRIGSVCLHLAADATEDEICRMALSGRNPSAYEPLGVER